VVGYDASPGADRALDTAAELAHACDDRLVIAHGVAPPAGSVGDEWTEHRHALEERAKAITEPALARVREQGVQAEVALVVKRPHEALLELAAKNDARFIVVGGWGESPIRGAILGSTPHKLLHMSPVPVVVVPA
jgi:nucleotide-binding universal stress UspA family protein